MKGDLCTFQYGLNMDGRIHPVKLTNAYNHATQIKVGVPMYSAFNIKKANVLNGVVKAMQILIQTRIQMQMILILIHVTNNS